MKGLPSHSHKIRAVIHSRGSSSEDRRCSSTSSSSSSYSFNCQSSNSDNQLHKIKTFPRKKFRSERLSPNPKCLDLIAQQLCSAIPLPNNFVNCVDASSCYLEECGNPLYDAPVLSETHRPAASLFRLIPAEQLKRMNDANALDNCLNDFTRMNITTVKTTVSNSGGSSSSSSAAVGIKQMLKGKSPECALVDVGVCSDEYLEDRNIDDGNESPPCSPIDDLETRLATPNEMQFLRTYLRQRRNAICIDF